MGYNTACMILNDELHMLAEREGVGREIRAAVLTAHRDGSHGPHGFKALQPQHADVAQVVVVTANNIRELGYGHWEDGSEALLRKLADQHGFRLVRKGAPRPRPPRVPGGWQAI